MAFSFWLAWNVTTRRAVIGISSPVLGLRPGPLRLLAQLEVAEARELDALAGLERHADFLEEALDHVLRLALVEPELLEQEVGQFGFCKRHRESWLTKRRAEVASGSRRQRLHRPLDLGVGQSTCSILHKHKNRNAFPTARQPAAAKRSNGRNPRRTEAAAARRTSTNRWTGTASSTTSGQVAPHDRAAAKPAARRDRPRQQRCEVELEGDRRGGQLEAPDQRRVQFAEPARHGAVDRDARPSVRDAAPGAAPLRSSASADAASAARSAFTSKMSTGRRGVAPLLGQRAPGREPAESQRLLEARRRRAGTRGRLRRCAHAARAGSRCVRATSISPGSSDVRITSRCAAIGFSTATGVGGRIERALGRRRHEAERHDLVPVARGEPRGAPRTASAATRGAAACAGRARTARRGSRRSRARARLPRRSPPRSPGRSATTAA